MSTETAVDPRIAKSNDALRTPMGEFWRKFKKQPVAMAAAGFVFFLIIVAIVGPMITPFDPENFFDYDRLNEGPSAVHWFGVDALGRDIFSRIVAGTRISLVCGFSSVFAGAVIGTILGLIAGFYEGWPDRIIMRISDVLFAFPGILLAIGIVAILGGGMLNVVAAVAIFSIPAFARLVRANVLSLKTQPGQSYKPHPVHQRHDASFPPYSARHDLCDSGLSLDAYRHVNHHRGIALLPGARRSAADA